MSGLSFSERVKLLLQKRLDATKWPIGDSGQGPGAIRYLSDGQGNAIALLTTSINPNDTEPIGPGSNEAAALKDPLFKANSIEIGYTLASKTNPVFKVLSAMVTTTNTIMTLEFPGGTDYQVPAGKLFIGYKIAVAASVAGVSWAIGTGTDGVATGTTEPTSPVMVIGIDSTGSGFKSPFTIPTADTIFEFNTFFEIAAALFPFAECDNTSGNKVITVYGVEVDA